MPKRLLFVLLILFLWSGIAPLNAQQYNTRVENGKLIFVLDLGWNEAQRKDFSQRFDLDSLILNKVYLGLSGFEADSTMWTVKKLPNNTVELSRDLDEPVLRDWNEVDLFRIEVPFPFGKTNPPSVGINDLIDPSVFRYENSLGTFYLPGNKSAKSVYLSGTFNGWSTMRTPMNRTDSGWVMTLPLNPGMYQYKFIRDGRWMTDPGNKLKEKNEEGTYNSVIYCPNHIFRLKNHEQARKVMLAGSFNSWNPRGIAMLHVNNGWELPVFLKEGTHLYKFIVDGEWITDPANKDIRRDADGNQNSCLGIGQSWLFRLKGFMDARQVVLSGSFNNWSGNELLMNKTTDGWELSYILPEGMHEYKFIVDGRWMPDPDNPYTTGSGDFVNSVMAFHPNYTFQLQGFPDAKEVILTGSFTGWRPNGYRMARVNDRWIFPVEFVPGKYTYKYIVDGKWILDPGNPLWENNEFGNGNSVLWINH